MTIAIGMITFSLGEAKMASMMQRYGCGLYITKVKFSPEERLDYTLQGVTHCFAGVGYSLPHEHNAAKFYRKGYLLAENAMKGRVR